MSLLSWLKGKDKPVTTSVESQIRMTMRPGQVDVDRTILEQLRKVGMDLSAPFHINYVFTTPTHESARQLAQELEARSLHAEVSEEGGRWRVVAPHDLVLTESELAGKRTEFTSLAGNFGGQYHGWEMKAKQTKSIKLG